MNRVVVTGATSMLGVALIQECIRQNTEVLAIVRSDSGRLDRLPKSNLIEVYESKLENLRFIQNIYKKYDVFYHFAWDYTSKDSRDNPVLQEKNIQYTLDAVELANRLKCSKFIGAGSQAEYGKVDGIIRADTVANPTIAYGVAKYAAGKLSEKRCSQLGMVHIWGRIFSLYGRYDNEGTMLVYAIDQFLKNREAVFSEATQLWDYLHESDAGKIFWRLGELVNRSGVYCVASGQPRVLKEFILELKECFDARVKCCFSASNKKDSIIGLNPDAEALFQDIDYTPQIKFKDGIIDMINYRKHKLEIERLER